MTYCLTHNQEFEELYPDFWECESCFSEYYGQDLDGLIKIQPPIQEEAIYDH